MKRLKRFLNNEIKMYEEFRRRPEMKDSDTHQKYAFGRIDAYEKIKKLITLDFSPNEL